PHPMRANGCIILGAQGVGRQAAKRVATSLLAWLRKRVDACDAEKPTFNEMGASVRFHETGRRKRYRQNIAAQPQTSSAHEDGSGTGATSNCKSCASRGCPSLTSISVTTVIRVVGSKSASGI